MWLLLAALTATAAEPVPSGRYVLAEAEADLKTKHAEAVTHGLKQLSWAFRAFARGPLSGAVNNCPTFQLQLDAEDFRYHCEGDDALTLKRATPSRKITGDDGKTYQVDLKTGSDHILLSFSGKDGGQRTTYRPQADGTLLVTKELVSSHLAEPVAWTVRYRQAD